MPGWQLPSVLLFKLLASPCLVRKKHIGELTIFQKSGVHSIPWQMYVSDNTASYEYILDRRLQTSQHDPLIPIRITHPSIGLVY